MSIAVNRLLKKYGGQNAVNHVSFSIGKGEIVGFLGPNGAGKSTTLKMITGYLAPDDGEVLVCDVPVESQPLPAKRKIGYLPESNALYADMYVREYLSFIAGVHGIKNPGKRIAEIVDLTGLTPECRKKIGQLSKGYKQRVGLAAALLHDPEVLILDEPTSGLDPNQIVEIRNVIKEQGKNKTVLFSTHILQEVQAVCDRVIIIHHGAIVADSSVEQLRQSTTSNRVAVTFSGQTNKAMLKALPAAISVAQPGDHNFSITTADTNELRRQLIELALKEHLDIVSLQTEGNNLEDIFRTLTMKHEQRSQ